MQKLLLLVSLLFCSQLHAQQIEGVWEGELLLNGSAKNKLKVRMELVGQDSSYFGILYSRGIEKSTMYGCDYFITGNRNRNSFRFQQQKVQRAVAMSTGECQLFGRLVFNYRKKDSIQIVQGRWIWRDGREDIITCNKVSDSISDMADDEISIYVNELYELYETSGRILSIDDRLPKKAVELQIDSTDIIVEFSTIDSSAHDSVSVYVNGKPIAHSQQLLQKPLRIRLKGLPLGASDLLVVNESLAQSKLNLQMKIIYQGQINLYTIQPSFTINTLVLFNRKEE